MMKSTNCSPSAPGFSPVHIVGAQLKGQPGIRPSSTCHRICIPLEAAAAEGINTAYTTVLKRVLPCYTYSSYVYW